MKPYEFLEHTADVKFRAYGASLREAFANAARALFASMVQIGEVSAVEERVVEVESNRLRSLLYDFLEEMVLLQDAEGFLLHDVREIELDERRLRVRAVLVGDIYRGQYELATQIKAITYSDMRIERRGQGWMIQVVPDI